MATTIVPSHRGLSLAGLTAVLTVLLLAGVVEVFVGSTLAGWRNALVAAAGAIAITVGLAAAFAHHGRQAPR